MQVPKTKMLICVANNSCNFRFIAVVRAPLIKEMCSQYWQLKAEHV